MIFCKVCGCCTEHRKWQVDAYEIHHEYRCVKNCKGGDTVIIERLPEPPRREIKEDPRAKRISKKDRADIMSLAIKGMTCKEIAEETGYSKATVWRICALQTIAAIGASKYFKGGLNGTV